MLFRGTKKNLSDRPFWLFPFVLAPSDCLSIQSYHNRMLKHKNGQFILGQCAINPKAPVSPGTRIKSIGYILLLLTCLVVWGLLFIVLFYRQE